MTENEIRLIERAALDLATGHHLLCERTDEERAMLKEVAEALDTEWENLTDRQREIREEYRLCTDYDYWRSKHSKQETKNSNTMDYEFEYKAALSRAKRQYEAIKNNEIIGDLSSLEEVFPVLKPTKDELTDKAIRYAVAQAAHEDGILIDGITKEDAIAWLDNHKPVWTEEDEEFVKYILPRVLKPDSWTLEQQRADLERLKDFIESFKNRYVPKDNA